MRRTEDATDALTLRPPGLGGTPIIESSPLFGIAWIDRVYPVRLYMEKLPMLDVGDAGAPPVSDGRVTACTERVATAGGGLHEAPSDIVGTGSGDGTSGGLPGVGGCACTGRGLTRSTTGDDPRGGDGEPSSSEGTYMLASEGTSG